MATDASAASNEKPRFPRFFNFVEHRTTSCLPLPRRVLRLCSTNFRDRKIRNHHARFVAKQFRVDMLIRKSPSGAWLPHARRLCARIRLAHKGQMLIRREVGNFSHEMRGVVQVLDVALRQTLITHLQLRFATTEHRFTLPQRSPPLMVPALAQPQHGQPSAR